MPTLYAIVLSRQSCWTGSAVRIVRRNVEQRQTSEETECYWEPSATWRRFVDVWETKGKKWDAGKNGPTAEADELTTVARSDEKKTKP